MKYFCGPLTVAMMLLALQGTGFAQKSGPAKQTGKTSTPTQVPKALNAQQIYEQFHDSIVRIETDKKQGSGFFLRDGQTIATAYHVLAGGTKITILGSHNETWVPVNCYLDEKADIAILVLAEKTGHKPIHLADFSKLRPGGDVTVISNALGLEGSVSTGVLSERRIDDNTELIQFSAAISPGSSGAPVLSYIGEAEGVVTSTLKSGQAINLAVAEPAIRRLLERKPQPVADFLASTAAEEAERKKKQEAEDAERQRNETARIAAICSQADASIDKIASLNTKIGQAVDDFTAKQKELTEVRDSVSRDKEAADRNYTAATLTQSHWDQARDKYAEDKRQADEAARNDRHGYLTAAWVAILITDQNEIAKQQREFEQLLQVGTELKISIRNSQDRADDLTTDLQSLAKTGEQLKSDLDKEQATLEAVCLASEQTVDPPKDIAGDWGSSDGGTYHFTTPSAFSIEYRSKNGSATVTGQFESLGGRLNLSIADIKVKAESETDQAEADKLASTFADGKKNGTNTLRSFQLWKSKTELTIIGSDGRRSDLTRK